ncbi:S8 family serine peptidase, partial [Streptacidiphilus anmyonensis]|uniref:S8 family serine peptidase n=1 Tax=Streptacidiphilus anmyonensis TaxID=405782 RepID=UPI001EEE7B90
MVWPHSTGKGVVVAVIDSGVRATHVDLRGQVLEGKDFAFGGDGQTDHSPEGHGTQMASLIAGHGHGPNGDDGIMGLAPGAKILPVGIGTGVLGQGPYVVPQAIRYAVDHGAQVVSMSFGIGSPNPVEESAVAYAEQHNVVLVAASGNDGTSEKQYPASWPGVIKVGAVDKTGKLTQESQTGGVTVVAPGADIVSDTNGSDTQMFMGHGTSDSTAYVAAIAALYRSAHPNLTAGQIVNYIIKTAIPPQGITTPDPGYGYGIASPDLTMAVSPGPASGPLPQATDPLKSSGSASGGSSRNDTASSSSSSSSMGIIIGVLGGLVVLVIIVVVLVRNRRGGGGGGNGGAGGGNGGQPAYAAQPQAYQPPTGQYGGQSPYGQPPQQPNPYGGGNQQYPPQQNPYGGRGGRCRG